MKRLLILAAVIVGVSVLPGPAVAGHTVTISVTFDSDATTAAISSSHAISAYSVRLCSGPLETDGDDENDDDDDENEGVRSLTIGPYGSPIVSVTVTSGRRTQMFASDVSCQPGTEIPESSSPILLPLSMLGTVGLVAAVAWHHRRRVSPASDGRAGHA